LANLVIVDDLVNSRTIIRNFVEMAGHQVIGEFSNGVDALDFLGDHEADLIVLDYNLNSFKDGKPYTGLDLLEDIKARSRDIRIIFISAFAKPEIIKNAIVKGALDFIVKPFTANDLIQRINKALN
jgi:two-component system chemotaxis response regulator CheY